MPEGLFILAISTISTLYIINDLIIWISSLHNPDQT